MYTQFFGNFLLSKGISLMSSFLTLSKKKHKSTQSSVLLPSTQAYDSCRG